ncbi:MAG: tetratricopeptide repeat protein, partial [Pseudomarimonas sp.]
MNSRSIQRAKSRAAPSHADKRMHGLSTVAASHLRGAAKFLSQGDVQAAELAVFAARISAPEHPESLRMAAAVLLRQQRMAEAATCLRQALATLPDDIELLFNLAVTANELADHATANACLRRATASAADAATWLRLAQEFDRQGYQEDALTCAEAALKVAPNDVAASLQRGRCLHALGRTAEASAQFRAVLALQPDSASAWFSLLDQKTARLDEAELEALIVAERRPKRDPDDQALLSFALGKALEDAGRLNEAFAAFARANHVARGQRAWDAAQFSKQVDTALQRFSGVVAATSSAQGREVIFVVGLPRSGTTLIEQVLAAHPQVEG